LFKERMKGEKKKLKNNAGCMVDRREEDRVK
jgi:hypothetical protein